MDILIVEDEPLAAAALEAIVELDPRHRVVGVATDQIGALEAARREAPDVALVDIQLANNSTGYAVAAALQAYGVRSVFITGGAPPFPTPELAIGCLTKPYGAADVLEILGLAEVALSGIAQMPKPASDRISMYVGVEA